MESESVPDGWRRVAIGDVADLRWGDTKTTKASYVTSGFPAYSASGRDGFLPHADYDKVGVVLSAIGADCGRTWLAKGRWSCIKNTIRFWSTDSDVDTRFLYWATRDPSFWPKRGSAQPFISQSDARNAEVLVPPISTQRQVAETLGKLDDRIANLRATNATLEAIAQALFKSWFVDFDPVHAKAEGRAPEGMDAATAALFPREFEDSELGAVPKGWPAVTLGDHVDADRGLSYKGAGLAEPGSGLPMHNLNSVLEGGGYKYAGIKHYTGAFKERHLVNAGEIIVANTEQGHHYRLIGFPAIVPASYPSALYSHHLYRVRLKATTPMTIEWLYRCLMARNVREQIVACANGSTVNMLKVVGLQIPRFALPPAAACRAFTAVVQPMRQAIEANVARIETLVHVRDTLLPRLISGKLRLPEARALAVDAAS